MHAERRLLPAHAAVPRWHFQHGPIDLVMVAEGEADAVAGAHEAAWRRFETVLPELTAELRALRLPVAGPCPLQGAIARRMWWACRPFHAQFITPMAAVAGAVAQELIALYEREGIQRAWVNNGGDIALHLAPGASARVGLFADLARFDPTAATAATTATTATAATTATIASLRTDAAFTVHASMPVRGIATSGWRGRSFSLGIADSVTVLARTAAQADAAATVIANAVNVADARIARRPANQLKDDADLGDIEVTVNVPALEAALVDQALQAGQRRARALQRDGLIHAAMLVCQDRFASVGVHGQVDGVIEAPTGWCLDGRRAELGSVFA
jgi:ApbE superfamily uncharacterized protein (UPF0280 family)